jgi:membrane associated rhomboid family serine protease
MLIVSFGVNGWKIAPLSVNPLIGPSPETLIKVGARQTYLIVVENQWFRLFSPIVLHAGLVHFFINMLAMWCLGAAVEQSHGHAACAILFIIPAVGGNILSAIFLPQYISVGASGGLFGLIGGCFADITLNWNLLFLKTTTDQDQRWLHRMVVFWLFMDIFINMLIGFTPIVDNFTHLGGLLYGFCCGLSTLERLGEGFFGVTGTKYDQFKKLVVRFFGIIVSVISIVVTTIVLANSDGTTSPCNGCRYISCVPFPFREEKWWYCDDCDFVSADLYAASDGSGLYETIDITCPGGNVTEVAIAKDGITSKEVLQKRLPTYCRDYCADVFASHRALF